LFVSFFYFAVVGSLSAPRLMKSQPRALRGHLAFPSKARCGVTLKAKPQ
jgi:hypothetical protein